MPGVGERFSPVRRVWRESHVLRDAVSDLSDGDPVFVRCGSALRMLTARHAVGFPLSRRLIDVPGDPVRLVSAEALSSDLHAADSADGVVAVERNGRIVGWLSSKGVHGAGTGEDHAWRHLLQALLHDCANSMMLVHAALEDVEPNQGSPSWVAAMASVEHATGLFRRLQSLCSDRAPNLPDVVPLSEFIEDLTPLLQLACGAGVRLSTSVPNTLPKVIAYRSGLERVVINLVINARDALERSGQIWISADKAASDDPADQGVSTERVLLAVEDDGPGVLPELGDTIFDAGISSKPGGERGLGLAGVRALLSRAGADIRMLRSSRGGARFEVVLRCAPS